MESIRSIVCNQAEERQIQGLRLDTIQFALRTDYIPLTRITYQAFGLDLDFIINGLSAIILPPSFVPLYHHKTKRARQSLAKQLLHYSLLLITSKKIPRRREKSEE